MLWTYARAPIDSSEVYSFFTLNTSASQAKRYKAREVLLDPRHDSRTESLRLRQCETWRYEAVWAWKYASAQIDMSLNQ